MRYDVIVIGGGLSGLTAASLLAKRGLRVAVIEKSREPGGSCGIFRRGEVTFDQGSAMLYGFGERGFNAHRFVFNCLEEPIDMLRHDLLYGVRFKGRRINFYADVDRFVEELSEIFPSERENIRRFYRDMYRMYQHVMVESPGYVTADETDGRTALQSMLKHPISYIRFLGMLNRSAESLLRRYFTTPEIFQFFDKLTSTYCYTTVAESPAVLAAVMFIDNHVGGSFYPAGSTLFLPGKLEKVIEENDGDMYLGTEAVSLIFSRKEPAGVRLADGRELFADDIIYSGTVWNLFGKLLDPSHTTAKQRAWAAKQVPTYPSVVLYACVDRSVIPEETLPVEMLTGNPAKIDESEVTAYILSIDDRTLCGEDEHTVMAIGPSYRNWEAADASEYGKWKEEEKARLIGVMEKRFPGFATAVKVAEVATPRTIERYTMKNGGAVAGPKQMLGQHMFRRLHTRTRWKNLFCCGESTVMGTGTPTVTTSGLSAANAVLTKRGLEPFIARPGMRNYVRIVPKPFRAEQMYENEPADARETMRAAMCCRFCERPTCTGKADIPGIMRRVAVGNFAGAIKVCRNTSMTEDEMTAAESRCIRRRDDLPAVRIAGILRSLDGRTR